MPTEEVLVLYIIVYSLLLQYLKLDSSFDTLSSFHCQF